MNIQRTNLIFSKKYKVMKIQIRKITNIHKIYEKPKELKIIPDQKVK
jgi:hypothetical protein